MLTIAELAKHYDKSEQTIRRAFKVMVKLNKLKSDEDYTKRNFKDDRHFVYEIEPGKFDEHYKAIAKRIDSQFETPSDIKPDIRTDNKNNESDMKTEEPVISSDIKDRYIASLEVQMDRKDKQIEHLQESVKLKDHLVIALNQQVLRLTEPKSNVRYEPVEGQPVVD